MMVIKALLAMSGALLALAALCGYCLWMEKKAPSEEYDERQKIEQGKASNISLMTGLIYFVVVMCWMEIGELPAAPEFLIFAGVMMELMVYHICCLMTHSSLPLSQKPRTTIGSYAALGVIWGGRACLYDPAWGMDLYGRGIGFWRLVMTSFCCFALAAMHLISHFRDKKE